jgi:hypothetical protein
MSFLDYIAILVQALWVPVLVTAAIFTAVGLVSVWAVLSRRHWFIRAVVVTAVLSATLAIRGHDVVLVFLLQSLVAIACILMLRTLRFRSMRANASKHVEREAKPDSASSSELQDAGPKYPQFSLLDLMLMVLVVAAICGVVTQTPPRLLVEWPAITITGLSFAGLTIWLRRELAAIIFRRNRPKWLARKPIRGKLHLAFRLFACIVLPSCVMLLVFPVAYVCHRVINPLPLPTVTLPDPNGYDDLKRACESLEGVTVPDPDAATPEELAAFVWDNGEIFELVRLGLSRESQVPVAYSPADFLRPDALEFRKLALALTAKGKLAEADGRIADAVTSYLDMLHLAKSASFGGLNTDAYVGAALEWSGMNQLASIAEALPRNDIPRVIATLQELDQRREPWESIAYRERAWWDNVPGGKVERALVFSLLGDGNHELTKSFGTRQQTRLRLLRCKLAIRCYQIDHDRLPNALADLVPEYIDAVPTDPYNGKPIVYRPDSIGPMLYSVGPDQRDDGGKQLKRMASTLTWPGDVLLSEPPYIDENPVEAE